MDQATWMWCHDTKTHQLFKTCQKKNIWLHTASFTILLNPRKQWAQGRVRRSRMRNPFTFYLIQLQQMKGEQ